MNDEHELAESLLFKCHECGIGAESFVKEKILELEERKRILLTPNADWFHNNFTNYNEYASKVLQRSLTEEEKYGQDSLVETIKRRFNPQQPFHVDDSIKRKLLEESNSRCKLCGVPLTKETIRVDHKVPTMEGGSPHTLNLQAMCERCNTGKSDYFEQTAEAAARPWYERRKALITGRVAINNKKRFCALIRDRSTCRMCGASASQVALVVELRVPAEQGGQAVYDNLITICDKCKK